MMSGALFSQEFTNSHASNELKTMYQNLHNLEWQKSVIADVNKLLSSSKTRYQGLELLQKLMQYFSYDVILENVLQWSDHCMVHYSDDPEKKLKLNLLTQILQIVKNTSDSEIVNKKFCADYLNNTLKSCLIVRNIEEQIAGLKCLTQCMKKYPSWFGNHKPKIESYLVECLGNSSEAVAEAAGAAFAQFLETGAAGTKGINYKNNFSRYFKKLCATIQNLYNDFFKNFTEIDNSTTINEEAFQFESLLTSAEAKNVDDVLVKRIVNCLIFMKMVIAKQFSVSKQVTLKHVVDIIHRGLSVHLCFSKTFLSNETNNRCILLKNIQIHLMILLRILLRRYQSNLLPFFDIIGNSLLNTLRRTDACDCFVYDCIFKKHLYKTLSCWLSLNNVINDLQLQEKLLSIIFKDISIPRKTVLLKSVASKNAKSTPDDRINQITLLNDVAENNCIYALETLKSLLSTNILIPHDLLKEIYFFIVQMLVDLQKRNIPPPYDKITCQTKLYETFVLFVKTETLKLPSSLHMTIKLLLDLGRTNPNWKISKICTEGLEILERIGHSACPTLFYSDVQQSIAFQSQDPTNSLKRNGETLLNEDEIPKKEIKIISNVLISSKMATTVIETESCMIDNNLNENEEAEEIIEVTDTETMDLEIMETEIVEGKEVCENDETPEIVVPKKVISENEASKMNIDADDGVEDMFCTFQDVIQE